VGCFHAPMARNCQSPSFDGAAAPSNDGDWQFRAMGA